jgi:hypothetical protein
VIIAVPEQEAVEVHPMAGIGPSLEPFADVITWYRWWCSVCRVSPANTRASGPRGALAQGDYHLRTEQCHVVGQLALFALAGGAR